MEFSPPLEDGSECATASSSTPTPWQCRTTLIQDNRDTLPFPSTSLEHLPVNPPEDAAAPTRQRWSSPFEFLVTCVGYAVGLGNFWRFPYLCYKHGGGAFLVPYSIVLVVIGMPLFLLELGVGQKLQVGPLQAWRKIHPCLAGVGMTGVLVTFFVALYYNIIVAWTLWYLFHSFAYPLPWAADQGGANAFWEESTLRCRPSRPRNAPNATCSWEGLDFGAEPSGAPGLFSPGEVVWPLFSCLVLAWLLVYCCVCKGVASIGKVALFTAIFPYLVLLVLLGRGVTLPGARLGLQYYLTPSWSKLASPTVWIAAASQIFYSCGVGWGTLVAFASYNDPSHNFVRDAWLVPLINCSTSFLAGVVVFSILGYMAHLTGQGVEQVVQGGTGLAFVVYPESLAAMPGAPVFSLLFFTMLLCLGLDTQFAMVETLMAALRDIPQVTMRKERLSALLCALMLACGTIFVTEQGVHWLEVFDTFVANISLFLVGLVECVAVGWLYGAKHFSADANAMCGRPLPKPLLWNLQYLIPLLLSGLLCSAALSSIQGEYDLPPRGVACGWALALVCCAPTPIMAWRAIKPCSWLWHRLRCGGDSAPPRIGDAAAGSPRLSPRRPNTRAGAALEMYAVHAGSLQGAALAEERRLSPSVEQVHRRQYYK